MKLTHSHYLDLVTNEVINQDALASFLDGLNFNGRLSELDVAPLWIGGGHRTEIAWECSRCGAPLGEWDPDDCRFVRMTICSGCREP